MKVEFYKDDLNFIKTLDQIIDLLKSSYPGAIREDNKINDAKRLFKRIIRFRHPLIYCGYVILDITIPIFLYNDLKVMYKNSIGEIEFDANNDILEFETSSEFSEKEESLLVCIFKKIKSTLKEFNIHDLNKARYFLPCSTLVHTTLHLKYCDVFELLAKCKKNNSKLYEFGREVFKLLNNKCPVIFNEQNVEVYLAHKEF